MNQQEEENQEKKDVSEQPRSINKLRGLYRNVNVSVHTLNIVIIAGIALIAILIAIGVANRGYTVTFNSNGGSDVESFDCMYGDLIEEPEEPTREGYEFNGWYSDENCSYLWDFDSDVVSSDMTLYAGWSGT